MSQVPQPTLADIEAMIAAGEIPTDDVGFAQAALLLLNAIRVGGGGGSGVQSVVAGTNVTVNNTDPHNPIVSASGGSPGLPVWTFQGSTGANPTSGGFTTDNASPVSTGIMRFSISPKDGVDVSEMFSSVLAGAGYLICVSRVTGKTQVFYATAVNVSLGIATVSGNLEGGDSTPWGDDLSVSVLNAGNLASILIFSGITPIANGTYFGITFQNGIAVSAATPQADGTVTPVTSGTIGSGGALLNLS